MNRLIAAGCVLLFLLLAVPRLSLPGLHHDEAFQAAEAVLLLKGGEAAAHPQAVSGLGGNGWLGGALPWMTLQYVGALKTYLFAADFAVFGSGAVSARGLNVALGALCLFFTVLLAWRPFGGPIAGALGLWIATDPAFLLMSRYDRGPYMLTAALKMAGLHALALGAERKSKPWLTAGGFLFGLALWDKAHFLWFLAALAVAAVLWIPSKEWKSRSVWGPALCGFAAGAAPFFLYNAVYPLATFRSQQALAGSALTAFAAAFPEILRDRLGQLIAMLDGKGLYHSVTGVFAPNLDARSSFGWAGAAFAAAALVFTDRRGALTPFLFWATAAVATAAAAFATPLAVGLHHMTMLYPLPHLALAALAAAAIRERGAAFGRLGAAALVLGVAGNLQFWVEFHSSLSSTRGSAEWYAGLSEVARVCAEAHVPVVSMNLMYTTPLVVYSGGAVIPEEGYPVLTDEGAAEAASRGRPEFLRPGSLLVAFTGNPELYRPPAGPAKFMDLELKRGDRLERAASVPYSDGGPWTDIYRVR